MVILQQTSKSFPAHDWLITPELIGCVLWVQQQIIFASVRSRFGLSPVSVIRRGRRPKMAAGFAEVVVDRPAAVVSLVQPMVCVPPTPSVRR